MYFRVKVMRGAKDFFGSTYRTFLGWGRRVENIWLVLVNLGGGGNIIYNLTSYFAGIPKKGKTIKKCFC